MTYTKIKVALFLATFFISAPGPAVAESKSCNNPQGKTFKVAPLYKAPDATRGAGVLVTINGRLERLPDTTASCLPLSLRLNNPGALQTPRAGPWKGQIAKDGHGHAVFATLSDGISAWMTWVARRTAANPNMTAFQMMSIYAPPDDCLGTVSKLPNGKCPPGRPLNPTLTYAKRIAQAVGKQPHDALVLDPTDCKDGRDSLFAIFREIMTFEAGIGFCGGAQCSVDRDIFDEAVTVSAGPIARGPCSVRTGARQDEIN